MLIPPSKKILSSPFLVSKKKKSAFSFPQQDALNMPVQNAAQSKLNRIHFIYACPECNKKEPYRIHLICLSRMQHKGTSTGYTLYACPECSTKEPQQLILPFLGTPTPIKSPGMNSFFRPQTINIYGRQSAWSGIKRKLTILPSQSSWTQNAFVHFSVVFQIQLPFFLFLERFYCSCFKCWGFSNKVFLKIKSLKKKKKKKKKKSCRYRQQWCPVDRRVDVMLETTHLYISDVGCEHWVYVNIVICNVG